MRLSYIEAIAKAIYEAAEADKRVLMIGAHWWGLTYTARRLFEPIFRDFPARVLVPEPVSELALAGSGIGAQILLPASPADAYHLLKWALLESENPAWFHSHPLLFDEVEEVDENGPPLPIGKARIRREGTDVSIIATSSMVPRSMGAAEILWQKHGVSAEVVDLRTIAPLDSETMIRSVAKTGRAVIADECHKQFGAVSGLGDFSRRSTLPGPA